MFHVCALPAGLISEVRAHSLFMCRIPPGLLPGCGDTQRTNHRQQSLQQEQPGLLARLGWSWAALLRQSHPREPPPSLGSCEMVGGPVG